MEGPCLVERRLRFRRGSTPGKTLIAVSRCPGSVPGVVRAVVLPAVAALPAVCAGVTACGPVDGPTAGGRSSVSLRQPLTESHLTKVLSVGDAPGFAVTPQTMPLLDHPRRAMVWALTKPEGVPADVPSGSLTLTRHEEEAARTWMAERKRATTDCTRCTVVSRVGWTRRFSVWPVSTAEAGDESVSYLLVNALAPGGRGNIMTVVRTGGRFRYLPRESGIRRAHTDVHSMWPTSCTTECGTRPAPERPVGAADESLLFVLALRTALLLVRAAGAVSCARAGVALSASASASALCSREGPV